ncbi:MAG: hypothetical protein EBS85_04515 [Micrococcales bacterium]|nr:hypothetical protein [Micrococcales bacterium]
MKFINQYFNARVISFASSQIVVLLGSLLRLPLISSESTLSTFALFLLYASALGLLPIFIGGMVNRTRMLILTHGNDQLLFSTTAKFLSIQCILIFLFLLNFFLFRFSAFGEVMLITITGLILRRFSPYYGSQQAHGKISQQNISQAIGATAGLVITFIIVKSPAWIAFDDIQRLNVLIAIAGFATLVPFIFARTAQRTMSSLITFSNAKSRSSFATNVSELASTLPPAALTFIDTLSLQFLSSPYQLSLYGINQRLSAVSTFMTGANYIKEANEVLGTGGISFKGAARRVLKFNLLNAPFLAAFVIASPFLTEYLSSGKVGVDWLLVSAYLLLALLQPAWVVVSNLVYSEKQLTHNLGKFVLLYVIPISILGTTIGALWLGAVGVVLATILGYCLAVALGSQLYWKK